MRAPTAALDWLYFVFFLFPDSSSGTDREEEMFLAGKAAYAGIVFLLLTTWISGPRPAPLAEAADLSKEVPGGSDSNNISRMQQSLLNKGHYRGKVDGVFGLRTRASIRAYQKAENLPITGQLDGQTAGKLGVTSETHEAAGDETAHSKPSAGIKRSKGPGWSHKTGPSAVKVDSHTESATREREKKLPAENE